MRTLPISGAALPRAGGARAWLAERSDGARLHAGVDLGHADDLVLAPEDGTVRYVVEASYAALTPRYSQPLGWAGYGPAAVVVEGDSGAWHLLAHVRDSGAWHLTAHVRAPRVAVGQRVAHGEVLAQVAAAGNHLHWEVRTRAKPPRGWATVEIALDPLAWLEGREERYSSEQNGCPRLPNDTTSTPRACRPGALAPTPLPPGPAEERGPVNPSKPRRARGYRSFGVRRGGPGEVREVKPAIAAAAKSG
jgi:murein DD-endopeptidase MepM/ murein hydrolase activator NlpD